VEPFGNDLIRMEMNGADVKAVLEQDAPGQPRLVARGLPAHAAYAGHARGFGRPRRAARGFTGLARRAR
jgi:2',3'-cyclic-nucleotide 2'-phosphodiesterase (5'-nucleotidase family)